MTHIHPLDLSGATYFGTIEPVYYLVNQFLDNVELLPIHCLVDYVSLMQFRSDGNFTKQAHQQSESFN